MTGLTLVRNETLKTARRPAFRAGVLALAAILSILALVRRTDAAGPAGFPDVWSAVIGDVGPIAPFFAAILVLLLVTGEFTFGTARQSVVDGLSKDAWFAGKLLLVPAVAAVFVLLMLGIGAASATLGSFGGAMVRPVDLAVIGAYATGVLLLVGGAFMCGMLVRGSGPAMAVFFFYVTLIENLIVLAVGRFSPAAGPALRLLPFRLFTALIDPGNHDASSVLRRAGAAAASEPFHSSQPFGPAALIGAGALWTIAFVTIAYLVNRRRDL